MDAGAAVPGEGGPRGGATRARERYSCFEHFGDEPQGYGTAVGRRSRRELRARRSLEQLVELRGSAAEYAVDGRAAAPRTRTSSPSRTPRLVAQRGALLPDDVPRAARILEPARPPHGRDARRAARPPRPARAGRQGRRLGAQLPPRRRARAPRWAGTASSTSASSRASGTASDAYSSASPRYGARSRPPRLGGARRWRSGCVPGLPGQLRGAAATAPALARFLLALRDDAALEPLAGRASNAPSASSTGPRPSARATTSRPSLARQFDAVVHLDRTQRARAARPRSRLDPRGRGARDVPVRRVSGPATRRPGSAERGQTNVSST